MSELKAQTCPAEVCTTEIKESVFDNAIIEKVLDENGNILNTENIEIVVSEKLYDDTVAELEHTRKMLSVERETNKRQLDDICIKLDKIINKIDDFKFETINLPRWIKWIMPKRFQEAYEKVHTLLVETLKNIRQTKTDILLDDNSSN